MLSPLDWKNKNLTRGRTHARVSTCVRVCLCCPCVLVLQHAVNHLICQLCCTVCRHTDTRTFLTANQAKQLLHQNSLWQISRQEKESQAHKWREKMEEWKAKDQQKSTVTAHGQNLNYFRLSTENYIFLITISAIIPNSQRTWGNANMQPHK